MTEEPNAATIAAATSAPKASPPDLRLRPPLPTVIRLPRKTVGIASAVTLAAIGGAFGSALYDKGLAAPAELLFAGGKTTADAVAGAPKDARTEERRVGKEGVRQVGSRWATK